MSVQNGRSGACGTLAGQGSHMVAMMIIGRQIAPLMMS